MNIEEDLKRHHHLNDMGDEEPKKSSPIKLIAGLFILLIIVTWTFSYYAGKIDPEPKTIPTRQEVVPLGLEFQNASTEKTNLYNYITPKDEEIKRIANRVATESCDGSRVCQAKAIYYFVRDNYEYISDPVESEYIEYPREFLSIGGGDCESGTIALSSLLESIGVYTELAFKPRHVFLKIKLPEASKRYQKDGWIYLDWTCKNCEFGVVP